MKINELPKDIQHRVFELQIAAGNRPNAELNLIDKIRQGNFTWASSIEDWPFWARINDHDFSEFETYYPDGVKDPRISAADLATDILKDCPITLSEHSYEDMHAHIVKKLLNYGI
jgi:hypothetical protein